MGNDSWQWAANVGGLLSGIGAIASVVVAIVLYWGQKALSKQLAEQQLSLTERLQTEQTQIAKQLHSESQRFAQRQLLFPLWEHLEDLRDINPQEPIWVDVVRAVNTMELIALCVEGGIIEQDVFHRAFGEMFLHLGRQIMKCQGQRPSDGKTGPDLLNGNRAARLLLNQLEAADMERGKLGHFTQRNST